MRENRIRVLKVEPKKAPEIAYLDNSLRALQEAVSAEADYVGLIEIIEIDDEACILCNEEAKLINLKPNRRCGGTSSAVRSMSRVRTAKATLPHSRMSCWHNIKSCLHRSRNLRKKMLPKRW